MYVEMNQGSCSNNNTSTSNARTTILVCYSHVKFKHYQAVSIKLSLYRRLSNFGGIRNRCSGRTPYVCGTQCVKNYVVSQAF